MALEKIVDTIILPDPLIFSTQTPILDAMLAMRESGASCVLAVEQQKLAGILTERDIVRAVSYQTPLNNMQIIDLMSSELITLRASEIKTIFQLTQLFKQHHIRHLPILDSQDQILGIVTPGSIRQRLRPEYLLRYVKVSEVMATKVFTAAPELSLLELTRRMMLHRVSCIVLVNGPETVPLGIITERDIVQFSTLGLAFDQVSAQTVMSTPLSTVQPPDSLWRVHQQMKKMRVRRLVVTDHQGKLAGIVTQTQVLKMCDPKELHYVMQTMQLVINRQKQELSNLNQALRAKNNELHRLAQFDELTQIANRRHFNICIHQEWKRLMRDKKPISLILGDIDNFKQFNDSFGHIAGDKCLQKIAQKLSSIVHRPQHLVARFGGEEFIIILPETDSDGAEHMAREILHQIHQLQIPHAESANGDHVSMSLGVVTTRPGPDRSVEDLLHTVDQLLYRAKRQGGNTYSLERLP